MGTEADDADESEGEPRTHDHQEVMFNFVPLGSWYENGDHSRRRSSLHMWPFRSYLNPDSDRSLLTEVVPKNNTSS